MNGDHNPSTDGEVGGLQDAVLAQLDWLTDTVTALTATAWPEPGTSSPAPAPDRAGPWWNLQTEHSGQTFQRLHRWVAWLTERYCLEETIPACWHQHGALVEELLALCAGWHAAYTDPHATGIEPLAWHGQLDAALARVGRWDRHGCVSGTHHPDPPATT